MSVGWRHSCAIAADDGTITCWKQTSEDLPTQPEDPSTQPTGILNSISAGYRFTCILDTESNIACWGWNLDAYCGGFDVDVSYWCAGKSYVDGPFSEVAVCSSHACGLRTNGTVACSIDKGYPDANHGQANPPSGQFSTITAGKYHLCGLRTDGTIVCWGGRYSNSKEALATPPSTLQP